MPDTALPVDFDNLPFSARVSRAVELGRQARTDANAAATLRTLETGGFTGRQLAAYAGHGSRDVAMLVRLCGDRSRLIAKLALKVLSHIADDATLVATLMAIPVRRRDRALRKLHRAAVVDTVVGTMAETGDVRAWTLVPGGSAALVDRWFATASECGGSVFWQRLVRRHPHTATEALVQRLDTLERPESHVVQPACEALAALSLPQPDLALRLARALARHLPQRSLNLSDLARVRPVEVADLVLELPAPTDTLIERVEQLGMDRIVRLARERPNTLTSPALWLRRLPANERAEAFGALATAWRDADNLLPPSLAERLPPALREAEARRALATPTLAADPAKRLEYAELLPFDPARAHVGGQLGHPDAELRAAALVTLCRSTRWQAERLPALVELLDSKRREQDPVRVRFLQAVAALPPSRWRAEQLPGLAKLIRAALDAADLSHSGIQSVGELVVRLLPFHADWAVGQLAVLARERAWTGTGSIMEFATIRALAPDIKELLAAWSGGERESNILSLAASAGRHLRDWPELLDAVRGIARHSATDWSVRRAVELIVRHVPAERERFVRQLLDSDESWILVSNVQEYVHRHRQDWLTPFLGRRSLHGRFSTGRVRHVLSVVDGFERWTDTQLRDFALTLAELANSSQNSAHSTHDAISAIRRLAALPVEGAARLIALAHDERPAVSEAALRALGRLDDGGGIGELLEAMADKRAPIAAYGLRSALIDATPARVLDVLRPVPLERVTVAKEVLRLAGEFGGVAALDWFAELEPRPLHRDVRAALNRAVWDHLDKPEAWAILERAAESTDVNIVIGLAQIPADRLGTAGRTRLARLLERLLSHAESTVRQAIFERLSKSPPADSTGGLLQTVLHSTLSDRDGERTAAVLAAVVLAGPRDAELFAETVRQLIPRRQPLVQFIGVLTTRLAVPRAVNQAVVAVLGGDAACTALQAGLAATTLDAESFAAWSARLPGGNRWNARTQNAIRQATHAAAWTVAERDSVETLWAASADAALRWLAVDQLVQVAGRDGWTAERRSRLERYRHDSSPLVADEAEFIFPPVVMPAERNT